MRVKDGHMRLWNRHMRLWYRPWVRTSRRMWSVRAKVRFM